MCGLGSAHKPRLRLGLNGSRPAQVVSRALSPLSREPGQAGGSGRGSVEGLHKATQNVSYRLHRLNNMLTHLSR